MRWNTRNFLHKVDSGVKERWLVIRNVKFGTLFIGNDVSDWALLHAFATVSAKSAEKVHFRVAVQPFAPSYAVL